MKKCEKRPSIMYRVGRVQIDVCSFESSKHKKEIEIRKVSFLLGLGSTFDLQKGEKKWDFSESEKHRKKHSRAITFGTLGSPEGGQNESKQV